MSTERRSRIYRACGILPRHMKRITNEHIGWGEAKEKAEGLQGNGSVIALVGQRGTGKTQLAAGLIRRAIKRADVDRYMETPDWTCYMTATQFFMRVKASYDDAKENEPAIIKDLLRPPILVIDEVHERKCSPWEDSLLITLLDTRYGHEKDTVLISNQSPEDFINNVGPSIADRMNEGGGIIEMNWKSFRGA